MIEYGKGICTLQQKAKEVIIHYKGNPYISHNHLEITHFLSNSLYVKNRNSKSLLIQGEGQIHIGSKTILKSLLFKYSGRFEIVKAVVGGQDVQAVADMDYCQLINTKFNEMGKPEQYVNGFKVGKGKNVRKNR